MSVSRDELEVLARLARLDLGPDEAGALADDLDRILEHVRTLQNVEGEAEPPEPIPSEESEPSAPSTPGSRPAPDPLRRHPSELAPAWREGFFVVPRLAPLDRGHGDGQGA